ncbi:glycoside hydrolase family 113 [Bacillus sp. FJAT-45037]|uniref:glycoside hydrolase family 113 n=1 Tax=Bacillus sp. FJAT-45037 TaxID=2011007 RepID=UPI000C24D5A8|nr:hypothetical protein [Bacillus sp. FJAT-45037]
MTRSIKNLISLSVTVTLVLILWFGHNHLSIDDEYSAQTQSMSGEPVIDTKGDENMTEAFQNISDLEPENESIEQRVDRKYESNEFQAGMNLLVYGHPNISDAKKLFNHLNSLGINSVTITFPFYQKDWQANHVMSDPTITPTISELKSLIQEAHAEELSVMIRPILDEQSLITSGHWRGQIQPTDPKEWFNSYRSLLLKYAELAQSNNVEFFNIGTEFNSLQNRYSDEWVKLIEDLRENYKGELIYSFNWDTVLDISTIEFVQLLDHIGIDAYYPLDAPDGASLETLEKAWGKWISELKTLTNQESIIITEAGMIPVDGAYRQPYAWSIPGGKLDRQAQATYYEATYNALRSVSKGIYWWCVTLDQDPGVIDYSPLNSPTEQVIKQHFLKDFIGE